MCSIQCGEFWVLFLTPNLSSALVLRIQTFDYMQVWPAMQCYLD